MFEEFVKNVQGFLTCPVTTFKQAGAKSLGVAYQYYATLLVIFTVLYGIVTLAIGAFMFNSYVQQVSMVPLIGKIVSTQLAKFGAFVMVSQLFYVYMVFVAMLFGVFLAGFLFHVFVILVDGKKGIRETLKTTMYAATPGLLLGWIPFICIIGWVWSFVLLILGFRDNNGLSFEKAVLVAVIPVVLGLLMLVLGSAVVSTFLGALVSLLPRPFSG
ncbi:MAG: YIP1 family protein [Methanomicrobiales archaeon]|nr:YIP1 family protein [Methanomicrobiales archaeon]